MDKGWDANRRLTLQGPARTPSSALDSQHTTSLANRAVVFFAWPDVAVQCVRFESALVPLIEEARGPVLYRNSLARNGCSQMCELSRSSNRHVAQVSLHCHMFLRRSGLPLLKHACRRLGLLHRTECISQHVARHLLRPRRQHLWWTGASGSVSDLQRCHSAGRSLQSRACTAPCTAGLHVDVAAHSLPWQILAACTPSP